jgi:hypothetical protein
MVYKLMDHILHIPEAVCGKSHPGIFGDASRQLTTDGTD